MTNKNRRPLIGILDSGIGGLHLLGSCIARIPQADYLYYADTKHMPYGTKTDEQVWRCVQEAVDLLYQRGCDVIALACNTATALCIDRLRQTFDVPFVGMQPAIRQALKDHPSCVVMATEATFRSPSFRRLCQQLGEERITLWHCPCLAEEIEKNVQDVASVALPKRQWERMPLVLGCTHYIYLKERLRREIFKEEEGWIFDGIEGTTRQISKKIGTNDHDLTTVPKTVFLGESITNMDYILQHFVEK